MRYKSDRSFRIWLYVVSHSSLIIRSEKQYEDVDYSIEYSPNCTIDIEFSGIKFISIPDNLKGLDLRKENGVYRFNENKKHYIKASFCRVGFSQFNHDEDKFSNYTLRYDETLEII